jgi:hypothetical protein
MTLMGYTEEVGLARKYELSLRHGLKT